MNLSNEDWEKYTCEHKKTWDRYSEIESGKKAWIDQGIAKGKAEVKAEAVKSLLQTTELSVEKIAQIANISIATVEEIKCSLILRKK